MLSFQSASHTDKGYIKLERYEKPDEIGRGTYGVVYKAKDKITGEFVALKKIPLKLEEDGIPSTAIREIALLKDLNHPNIVKLHDIVYSNKILFMVFECCDLDLGKYMTKLKPECLSIPTVKSFLLQLTRSVYHCHSNKILHRDLKPQNLLVNYSGVLKLCDFGLARAIGIPVKSMTNEVVTLWYRAPDILLGSKHYSSSIDIWSLGCIFAEMLNGKALFCGDQEEDQLNKIFEIMGSPNPSTWPELESLTDWKLFEYLDEPGQNLSDVVPRAGPLGIDLLKKMLEMNPKYRISALEILEHPYLKDAQESISLKL